MITRPTPSQVRSIPAFLLPFKTTSTAVRQVHSRVRPPGIVPSPTPFVPNVNTFLRLIGRNLIAHESKIPSWRGLFLLTSAQLRELGVEPARTRRYLLRWREKFRHGIHGFGGDLKTIVDGVAKVQIVEIPTTSPAPATATSLPGFKKVILNVPETGVDNLNVSEMQPVKGLKIRGASTIYGPYVLPAKGGGATITVQDGMWEDKRGRKVDGGERRQAEVRAKRRGEEKKKLASGKK